MSDYAKRIASLPPDKRALLELKLKQKGQVTAAARQSEPSPARPSNWLSGDALERHVVYWKERLGHAPQAAAFPVARAAGGQSHIVKQISFRAHRELSDSVKAVCKLHDASLFVMLLTALNVLLYRYTEEESLTVGTSVPIDTENISPGGPATNTLALRVRISGDMQFDEALSRARQAVEGAIAHKNLPFDQLIDALYSKRDLRRSPLFRAMLVLQSEANKIAASDGPTCDFVLTASDAGPDLSFVIDYNANLYYEASVALIADQYLALLEGITCDPKNRVADLPLWTGVDQMRVATQPESEPLEYPSDARLHELFEERVEQSPDEIALEDDGRAISYSQLNARANSLASDLNQLSIEAGALIGICLESIVEQAAAMLGAAKAGGAFFIIDSSLPKEQIKAVVTRIRPRAIVTSKASATLFDALDVEILTPRDEEKTCNSIEAGSTRRTNLDDPVYASFEPQSEDQPRGMLLTHRDAVGLFFALDELAESGVAVNLPDEQTRTDSDWPLIMLWRLTRGDRIDSRSSQAEKESLGRAGLQAEDRSMQFSLFYFSSDEPGADADKYRLVFEGAKFADRHGFTAVWVPERHFHQFGGLYPNPSTLAAALAMVTERIQLRAGSVVLPLHNPIRVAEEWSLVDNLSKGRVGLAFASGWHANDFVLSPDSYANRRGVMLKSIDVIKRLWRGEAVRLPDGASEEIDVKIFPRPIQPELPIWITAAGTLETYAAAGELGASILTNLLGQSLEGLSKKLSVYRQSLEAHGHRSGHVTLMMHTFIGKSVDEVRETVRRPFSDYIRTFTGLLDSLAKSLKLQKKLESFTEEDHNALVSYAFDRYFNTSALFGTPTSCLDMISRLKQMGVDEVACLIDFGIDFDQVLESLNYLSELKDLCNAQRRVAASAASNRPQSSVSDLQPKTATNQGLRAITLNPRLAASRLYLLDSKLNPVPTGIPGFLYVGSESLEQGFRNWPELTAERSIPNPFSASGGSRLFKTASRGCYLSDGRIELLGQSE